MPQIFVFTAGNQVAQQQLAHSIVNPIDEETVFASFEPSYRERLESIRNEGNGFYAWGAMPGERNLPAWDAMERGDYVLCVYGSAYRYLARVVAKSENRRFAESVWGTNEAGKTWQYMYFLTKPLKVNRQLSEVEDYLPARYMGFTRISDSRLSTILDDYGSAENFIYERFIRRRSAARTEGRAASNVSDAGVVHLRTAKPSTRWDEYVVDRQQGYGERPGPISIDEPLRRAAPEPLGEIHLPENYPLPLVHSYRIVEGEIDLSTILKQLYRNAEGLTAFLASLAVALAPPPMGKHKETLRRAWSGNGATFGQWYSVLDKTIPTIDEHKGPLYHSIKRLLGKEEPSSFSENMSWLIKRRNQSAHGDSPIGTNAEQLIHEVSKRFEQCVSECTPIWEHPLRLVLDYDAVRNSDQVMAICSDFSTEHLVGRKVRERMRGIPKKNDLYILQGTREWISLYPFISVHACPSCNQKETYFIDAWKASGREASLQSFQRAHIRGSQEVAQELALRLV